MKRLLPYLVGSLVGVVFAYAWIGMVDPMKEREIDRDRERERERVTKAVDEKLPVEEAVQAIAQVEALHPVILEPVEPTEPEVVVKQPPLALVQADQADQADQTDQTELKQESEQEPEIVSEIVSELEPVRQSIVLGAETEEKPESELKIETDQPCEEAACQRRAACLQETLRIRNYIDESKANCYQFGADSQRCRAYYQQLVKQYQPERCQQRNGYGYRWY